MEERGITRRNPGIVWVLAIITLGIYWLYWYYTVNRELAARFPSIEVNPLGAVAAVTIGGLVIIPPFVSVHNTGGRIRHSQVDSGLEPTCRPAIGLLLFLVFGLNIAYHQIQLNAIADELEVEPYGA